jgi:RNA 2',3'-cyclic 3'-phosphodiesterase
MRAFLAFEIPKDVKEYLTVISRTMARTMEGVRWVRDEGIHVTVKFFGEIDEERVGEIGLALNHIPNRYGAVETSISVIGAFPDRKRARVIIVTMEKGVDKLRSIFDDIERSLARLGIEQESRRFTPHLTLGRRKIPAPLLERDIPELEKKQFIMNRIVLFQSTLTRESSIYTPKWALTLGGAYGT